jgi:hypothetical protein
MKSRGKNNAPHSRGMRRSTHKTRRGLKRQSRRRPLIRRRAQKGGAEPVVGAKTRSWVSAFKEQLEAINRVVPTFGALISPTLTLSTFAEEPMPTNSSVEGPYNLTLNVVDGLMEINDLRNLAAATFQILRILNPQITKEGVGTLTADEFFGLMESAAGAPTSDYVDMLAFLLKGENSLRSIGGDERLKDLHSDRTAVLYIWGALVNAPAEDLDPIAPALDMGEAAPMQKAPSAPEE